MTLGLHDARAHADRAIAAAAKLRVAIAVCVVDDVGMVLQLDRMDGAPLMAPDLAQAKALTALNFGIATGDIVPSIGAAELEYIARVVHFPVFAVPGGVPLDRDGQRIGALGVSGASPRDDGQIATHALDPG